MHVGTAQATSEPSAATNLRRPFGYGDFRHVALQLFDPERFRLIEQAIASRFERAAGIGKPLFLLGLGELRAQQPAYCAEARDVGSGLVLGEGKDGIVAALEEIDHRPLAMKKARA